MCVRQNELKINLKLYSQLKDRERGRKLRLIFTFYYFIVVIKREQDILLFGEMKWEGIETNRREEQQNEKRKMNVRN